MNGPRKIQPFGSKPFRDFLGDLDDYRCWCKYPEHRLECRLEAQKPSLIQATGRVLTPRHVQFIVGSEPVPRQSEDFSDVLNDDREIESTFRKLDCTVEVCKVTCRADLTAALGRPARFRVVFMHGDEHFGLACPDGDLAWDDVPLMIGETGLLVLLSCFSHDVEIPDPDEDGEECSLPDALFPLVNGYRRRVNALITATGSSHHFRWRFNDHTHFEIQRMAALFELCERHGFGEAVQVWNAELAKNLKPEVVESIRGHERIRGFSGNICGKPVET
jgi:hypothetical protein